jgi:hypothetical protein
MPGGSVSRQGVWYNLIQNIRNSSNWGWGYVRFRIYTSKAADTQSATYATHAM